MTSTKSFNSLSDLRTAKDKSNDRNYLVKKINKRFLEKQKPKIEMCCNYTAQTKTILGGEA